MIQTITYFIASVIRQVGEHIEVFGGRLQADARLLRDAVDGVETRVTWRRRSVTTARTASITRRLFTSSASVLCRKYQMTPNKKSVVAKTSVRWYVRRERNDGFACNPVHDFLAVRGTHQAIYVDKDTDRYGCLPHDFPEGFRKLEQEVVPDRVQRKERARWAAHSRRKL